MSTQSSLLKEKRFLPYFITQTLGAFNDNVYKNVFLILVAFSAPGTLAMSTDLFINLAAALFILPFFLFSAFAGELTDKYEKSQLIRIVKIAEIIIMCMAAIALIYQEYTLLLVLLFLMGTQSAFFGPVKYALLPQVLKPNELLTGNAFVEIGTFLAILIGTILAGFIAYQPNAHYVAAFTVILLAAMGYLSARKIPYAPANNPQLNIQFSPIRQIKKTLIIAHKNKIVLQSVLGSSWFWFLGTCYLTQFPNFSKVYLGGDETSVSFLLALFSIGITIGALLCDKLSNHRIEPGIVPIGALGITIFGISLAFSTPNQPMVTAGLLEFIAEPRLWWVFFDLFMIGIFAGIFIVPLYAIMQNRAEETERSQVIAAHNIYSSLFMVLAAVIAIVLLGMMKMSIPDFFLTIAICNLVIGLYACKQVPLFMLRFIVWLFSHSIYRVTHKGLEHIPEKGGVLLVCNHVSYMDALLLGGASVRPIRFVMWADFVKLPLLKYFFKASRVIPISYEKKTILAAFTEVKKQLEAGEVVLIFPEGELTYDGKLNEFRRGMDIILKQTPVPVVPLALKGMWGSYFSREGGKAMLKRPRRFWSRITIIAGEAISPQDASASLLHARVKALLEQED